MKPLKQALEEAERSKLIDDVVTLIDGEVARKGGISGMVLRKGYKVVKSLKGGRMIHRASDHLLDDLTGAIIPLHDEFREGGASGSFADYLKRNESRAAGALLAITDGRAARAQHALMKRTYKTLRPQAEKHVKEALPGLGRLIDGYT